MKEERDGGGKGEKGGERRERMGREKEEDRKVKRNGRGQKRVSVLNPPRPSSGITSTSTNSSLYRDKLRHLLSRVAQSENNLHIGLHPAKK